MPRTNREELGGRLEDLLDISHGAEQITLEKGVSGWSRRNIHVTSHVSLAPRATVQFLVETYIDIYALTYVYRLEYLWWRATSYTLGN